MLSRSLAVVVLAVVVVPVIAQATVGAPSNPTRGAGGPSSTSTAADGPGFVATYPNPVVDGDAGEYVLLSFPRSTNVANWTLSDGEATMRFGNRTITGRVLVASDVDAAREHLANATASGSTAAGASDGSTGNVTTVSASGLALSNAGETLALANASGTVVAELSYANAPEGERYVDGSFRPLGATDFEPQRSRNVSTRAFVTPDTPVPLAPIRRADDHVYLAGYTFASERVARALERASARGVDVRVLVDDAPVGGITRRQVRVLNDLADSAVAVRALGGDRGRYDYQHAKYLVADDSAVVLTENWKPSGTGGHANRGWGVVLHDAETASDVERVFEQDWHALDARPWHAVTADVAVDPAPPANATYATRRPAANVTADSVTVVTAPDNAERVLVAELRNATERVLVLQMTADRDSVLVREAIAASRRGVDVRVLLSSAWYAREANARTVDALEALADREGLPLDAKLVDPAGRFEKVHAKGVVVDDAVVVGSINWNDHSLRENRELAVVLRGDAVANYYANAFDADWEGGTTPRVPRWLAVAAVLAVIVLLAVLARHVELETCR